MAESNPIDPSLVPPRRRFIDGVHNHCDRWCERCRFQDRCRLYRDVQRDQAEAAGRPFPSREEDDAMQEPDARPPVTERQRLEFFAWLDLINVPLTAEEGAAMDRDAAPRLALERRHELTVAGEEYEAIADGLVQVLRHHPVISADPVALAALETIGRLVPVVRWRLRRASATLVARDLPLPFSCEDGEGDDLQSDGNGCAKIARLVLAELRDAWEVLRTASLAVADGVPMAMVRRSEALDELVAAHFPRAMAFVRPGFDDGSG